jgi:hypothetical protein
MKLAGGIPEFCPSHNNWLGMPTKVDDSMTGSRTKVERKLALFRVWDQYCILNRTKVDR